MTFKLSADLRSSKKGLINIKNNDQKYFLWCYVRHINLVKMHPERITQKDKKLVNDLSYDGVGLPVWEKDFSKTETKNNICINVFCYENRMTLWIKSKIWKLYGFVAYNWWKQVTLCVYQRFWQIYVSQTKK